MLTQDTQIETQEDKKSSPPHIASTTAMQALELVQLTAPPQSNTSQRTSGEHFEYLYQHQQQTSH